MLTWTSDIEIDIRRENTLKKFFLMVDNKISKDKQKQIKDIDYSAMINKIYKNEILFSDLEKLSSDEFFDIIVGQMRFF